MKRILTTLFAMSVAQTALAAFTLSVQPVDNSAGITDGVDPIIPATDYTVDLRFDSADEVWYSLNLTADVTGGVFFQHAIDGNVLSPNVLFPATEFDTAAIAPYGDYLEFAGYSATSTSISHHFADSGAFDEVPSVNPVSIYRFTVRLGNPDLAGTLRLSGNLSTAQNLDERPFDELVVSVPEPNVASLFLLGLVGFRCRRNRHPRPAA